MVCKVDQEIASLYRAEADIRTRKMMDTLSQHMLKIIN